MSSTKCPGFWVNLDGFKREEGFRNVRACPSTTGGGSGGATGRRWTWRRRSGAFWRRLTETGKALTRSPVANRADAMIPMNPRSENFAWKRAPAPADILHPE